MLRTLCKTMTWTSEVFSKGMKHILLVGILTAVCFGQRIERRSCENPCNVGVMKALGNASRTNQKSVPILKIHQDRRWIANRWRVPASRSDIAPLVNVRCIAE